MPAPAIVDGFSLAQRVTELGCADVHGPRDAAYALPSEDWLRNQFGPFLKNEFWAYSRKYIREKFDCDDFATESDIEADLDLLAGMVMDVYKGLRARMAVKAAVRSLCANPEIVGSGVAFGYCEVTIAAGESLNGVPGPGRHATNLVLTPDGAFFFEPQNSEVFDAKTILDRGDVSLDWVWL